MRTAHPVPFLPVENQVQEPDKSTTDGHNAETAERGSPSVSVNTNNIQEQVGSFTPSHEPQQLQNAHGVQYAQRIHTSPYYMTDNSNALFYSSPISGHCDRAAPAIGVRGGSEEMLNEIKDIKGILCRLCNIIVVGGVALIVLVATMLLSKHK